MNTIDLKKRWSCLSLQPCMGVKHPIIRAAKFKDTKAVWLIDICNHWTSFKTDGHVAGCQAFAVTPNILSLSNGGLAKASREELRPKYTKTKESKCCCCSPAECSTEAQTRGKSVHFHRSRGSKGTKPPLRLSISVTAFIAALLYFWRPAWKKNLNNKRFFLSF